MSERFSSRPADSSSSSPLRRKSTRQRSRFAGKRPGLGLELLEDRRVLATITGLLANGEFQWEGDAAANQVSVAYLGKADAPANLVDRYEFRSTSDSISLKVPFGLTVIDEAATRNAYFTEGAISLAGGTRQFELLGTTTLVDPTQMALIAQKLAPCPGGLKSCSPVNVIQTVPANTSLLVSIPDRLLASMSISLLGGSDELRVLSTNDPIIADGGNNGGDTIAGPDVAPAVTAANPEVSPSWTLGTENSVRVWNGLDAANAAGLQQIPRVQFAGFGTVRGGTGNDHFQVAPGAAPISLFGGSGDDVFQIDSKLTGLVDGESGGDTLQGTCINAARLTGSDASGFRGTENDITGGFSGLDAIRGSGGSLTGLDADSTWTFDLANTYQEAAGTLTFEGFNEMVGGSGRDDFRVLRFANDLIGGGGDDSFLVESGGFAEAMRGGAGVDRISVVDGSLYQVTGENSGSIPGRTFGFGEVETLVGGGNDDVFEFSDGGELTGSVDAGLGADLIRATNVALTAPGGTEGFAGNVTDSSNALIGTFNDVEQFRGGGTLSGQGVPATWTLAATNTYAVPATGRTALFSDFTTLQGGVGVDTFQVTGPYLGAVKAGGGDDQIAFGNSGTIRGYLDGESGTDTLTGDSDGNAFVILQSGGGLLATKIGGGWSGVENLAGGAATDSFQFANAGVLAGTIDGAGGADDTLIGDHDGNVFTITGADSGTLATKLASWAGVEHLLGGAGADSFVVSGGTLAGSVDGVTGPDRLTALNIALTGLGALEGFRGTAAGLARGFENLEEVDGTGILTGLHTAATWQLAPVRTYRDAASTRVLTFGGFGTLQGGGAADRFQIESPIAANLLGGSGDDTFSLADAGQVVGRIDGQGGNNTLAGAPGSPNAFVVTGADAGTLASVTAGWSAIANLRGGAGADSFDVRGGTLSGSADGQAGADILLADNVVFTAAGSTDGFRGTAPGRVGGFDNINTATGSGTLTGLDSASTWTLGGAPTYTAAGRTASFNGFTALRGGAATDAFTVSSAITVDLFGGDGADLFSFGDSGTLAAGKIDGQGGADTLVGDSDGNAFTLTGADAGQLTGKLGDWKGIETLAGGSGADTFNIVAGSLSGAIDGQAGSDTLLAVNVALTKLGTIDGFAGASANLAGGFDNIHGLSGTGELTGLDGAATWTGGGTPTLTDTTSGRSASIVGFSTWRGGAGADTFDIVVAGVTGSLLGGAGDDVFNFGDAGSITGALDGQAGMDTLRGDGDGNLFQVTAANGGTLAGKVAGWSNVEHLQGGAGVDEFHFMAAGVLSGALDGGAGGDLLDVAGLADGSLVLTGSVANGFTGTSPSRAFQEFRGVNSLVGNAAAGTLTGLGTSVVAVPQTWTLDGTSTYNDGVRDLAFQGFQTLQGGDAVDLFLVTAAATYDLSGGGGNDGFNLDAILTGNLDGGTGSDTLDLATLSLPAVPLDVTLVNRDTSGWGGQALAGAVAAITAGFNHVDLLLAGASAADIVRGVDLDATWTIQGASTIYSRSSGGSDLELMAFDTLQGGTGADVFDVQASSAADLIGGSGDDLVRVAAGTVLTGSFSGQAGWDELRVGTAAANADLAASTAAGFDGTVTGLTGGFTGVDSLHGGGTGILSGRDADGTWSLVSTTRYAVGAQSLSFSGFATLQGKGGVDRFQIDDAQTLELRGGGGNDEFALAFGAVLTGSVDGEAGVDSLELGAPSASAVLTGSDATGYAGTGTGLTEFQGIRVLTGTGDGSLTGRNAASQWSLGAAATYDDGAGNGTLAISLFDHLVGGSLADTFTVDAALFADSASVDGGAGADTLVFNSGALSRVQTASMLAAGRTVIRYSAVETLPAMPAAADVTGDANPNVLVISAAGYTLDGGAMVALPATPIRFVANGGADQLVLDYSGGFFTNAVLYEGAGETDTIQLLGDGDFTRHVFLNSSDGGINIARGANAAAILFTGVEGTTDDQLVSPQREFLFWGGGETIQLADGAPADNRMVISSSQGGTINFGNPAAGLWIQSAGGDDTIRVAVDIGYQGMLTIDAGAGADHVHLDSSLRLAGILDASAETIHLNAGSYATDLGAASGIAFRGDVVLSPGSAGVALDTDGAVDGDVTFFGRVDGAKTLAITKGVGRVFLDESVGSGMPLASLTVDGGGETRLAGAVVVTSGPQSYGAPVFVEANLALSSSAAGQISFAGTVDGPGALVVNTAGDTVFSAALGGISPLGGLTTDSAGVGGTRLGGNVTTRGAVRLNDPVVLSADSVVTNQASDGVSFASAVDGNGVARSLTVDTPSGGATRFGGRVGAGGPLNSLRTDVHGFTVLNSATVLAATVEFADDVRVDRDTHVTGTISVQFSAALDSVAGEQNDLLVDGSPLVTLPGPIGASTPMGDLTILGGAASVGEVSANSITLTVGSLTPTGLSYTSTTTLRVTTNSSLTLSAESFWSAGGALEFTANDTGPATVDLTVSQGASLRSAAGNVVLRAGDALTLEPRSAVRGAQVQIATDVGVADATGTTIDLFGAVTSDVGPTTVTGGPETDTLTIDNNGGAAGGTLDGILSTLSFDGGNGVDSLVLNDFGDASGDTFQITSARIAADPADHLFGGPGVGLDYAGVESISIQLGNAQGDSVTIASLLATTNYTLDGNLPTTGPGDSLRLGLADISLFANAANQVIVGGAANLAFTEFESLAAAPSDGRLTVVGDRGQGTAAGGAGTDVADVIDITGTATRAGTIAFNGVAIAIGFSQVSQLQVNTHELADSINVRPVRDWNLLATLDAGAGVDRLTYFNVGQFNDQTNLPVVGPGAGRVQSPGVGEVGTDRVVSFAGVEDVTLNANPGDSDQLALTGTANDDEIRLLFDNIPGNDDIQITNGFDVVVDTSSYRALTVDGGSGNDRFILDLQGAASGTLPLSLTIDGAGAGDADTLVAQGHSAAADHFRVVRGSTNTSGNLAVAGVDVGGVAFLGIEKIDLDGGGSTGADVVQVDGGEASDKLELTPSGLVGATIKNAGNAPEITVRNLGQTGVASSVIELNGMGGGDEFKVQSPDFANWRIARLALNGESPGTDSVATPPDTLDLDFASVLTLDNTVARKGTFTVAGGVSVIEFASVEDVTSTAAYSINPLAGTAANDVFGVHLENTGNDLVLSRAGQGIFRGRRAAISGGLTFNTDLGIDTLRLDFGGGNPIPDGGIVLNADAPATPFGDSLVIENGTVANLSFRATATGATFNVDGKLVTTTGLDAAAILPTNLTNLTVDLSAKAVGETVVLQDDASEQGGLSEILLSASLLGALTFRNPQTALTVVGTAQPDVVIAQPLDSSFNASVNISTRDSADQIALNARTGTGRYTVDGGNGSDQLLGSAAGHAWQITGADRGHLDLDTAIVFLAIENLAGGAGADTWTFDVAGSLSGAVDGGGGGDSLVGDADGNTFTVTGVNSGLLAGKLATWGNIENLRGGTGVDSFVFENGGSLAGSIDGAGGDADVLGGDQDGNDFRITGVNTGGLGGKTSAWSSIEQLIGGAGVDQFVFLNAGNLTGTIAGGAGADVLRGDQDGNAFTVTAAEAGQLAGKTAGWTEIENIEGGDGDDSFVFLAGSLAGNVQGGQGLDLLDFSALSATSIRLLHFDNLGFVGESLTPNTVDQFWGINRVVGSATGKGDRIEGLNAFAQWSLDPVTGDQMAVCDQVLGLANWESYLGGDQGDLFYVRRTLAGAPITLNGGGGVDAFYLGSLDTTGGTLNDLVATVTIQGGGSDALPESRLNATADLDNIAGCGAIDSGCEFQTVVANNLPFRNFTYGRVPGIRSIGAVPASRGDRVVFLDTATVGSSDDLTNLTDVAGMDQVQLSRGPSANAQTLVAVVNEVDVVKFVGGPSTKRVRVNMSSTSATRLPFFMELDGGNVDPSRSVLAINGSDVNDFIHVATNTLGGAPLSAVRFSHLEVSAGDGNDVVLNGTAIPSLLDGGKGVDLLSGGSGDDLIFGGPDRDALFGNNGDDALLSDHQFNFSTDGFNPPTPANNDLLSGGAGANTGVALPDLPTYDPARPDVTSLMGIGAIFCQTGTQASVFEWLYQGFQCNANDPAQINRLITSLIADFNQDTKRPATLVAGAAPEAAAPRQNPSNRYDVNADGQSTPADALVVINRLSALGEGESGGTPTPFYDVNGDKFVTPADVLMVINHLNAAAGGEGEAGLAAPIATNFSLPDTNSDVRRTTNWTGAGEGAGTGQASRSVSRPGVQPFSADIGPSLATPGITTGETDDDDADEWEDLLETLARDASAAVRRTD